MKMRYYPYSGRILHNFIKGLDGGAEGNRTPDLLIANETLYQLSYDPIQFTTSAL